MTPDAAYEYVKSIRPRVLLASSQWQVSMKLVFFFFDNHEACLLVVIIFNIEVL